MKYVILLTTICLSQNVFARGVLLQCWEKAVPQTEENIIYQSNGGYIFEDFLVFDNIKTNHFENTGYCISWDLPNTCTDVLTFPNGDTVEVKLTTTSEFQNGDEGLEGEIYGVEITPVYCKRSIQ